MDDEDSEEPDVIAETYPKDVRVKAAPASESTGSPPREQKPIGPSATGSTAPRALTKSALLKEAQAREQLRKEFLIMQEAVKATEIVIPFVFFDGTNIPGGSCKIKKGEHIWLLLDRSRKVGAELGVGNNEKSSSRREWARVGVDDLMLVRGDIIIPHHYEIYYFIINQTKGSNGKLLFDYTSTVEPAKKGGLAAGTEEDSNFEPLSMPSNSSGKTAGKVTPLDDHLEGAKDDPTFTKVVDRRWYERNKHIFPASTWEDYDPGKDYTMTVRKDAEGNAFFF